MDKAQNNILASKLDKFFLSIKQGWLYFTPNNTKIPNLWFQYLELLFKKHKHINSMTLLSISKNVTLWNIYTLHKSAFGKDIIIITWKLIMKYSLWMGDAVFVEKNGCIWSGIPNWIDTHVQGQVASKVFVTSGDDVHSASKHTTRLQYLEVNRYVIIVIFLCNW